MIADWLFPGVFALLVILLLAYVLIPTFRAGVDADSAARHERRSGHRQVSEARDTVTDEGQDAEIWPDPPGGREAHDRWFAANGTGEDPRKP